MFQVYTRDHGLDRALADFRAKFNREPLAVWVHPTVELKATLPVVHNRHVPIYALYLEVQRERQQPTLI